MLRCLSAEIWALILSQFTAKTASLPKISKNTLEMSKILQNKDELRAHVYCVNLYSLYRVTHFQLSDFVWQLSIDKCKFSTNTNWFLYQNIMTFDILGSFSPKKCQRGAQLSFKNVAKYFYPKYYVGKKSIFLKIAYIYINNWFKGKKLKKKIQNFNKLFLIQRGDPLDRKKIKIFLKFFFSLFPFKMT